MTEHDQKACLRCGTATGGHCFCESCRSELDSSTGMPTCTGAGAKAAGEVRLEEGGAAGDAGSDRIAAEPPRAAVGVDPEPPPGDSSNIELRAAGLEPDKLSTSAEERLDKRARPLRGVARFEELLTKKKVDPELAALQRSDAAGDPHGATNLGVLLEKRGDLKGALAAYKRADRRGDVNGSFNLGCLLAEMGDLVGAQAALQRADERGDACGASNLGVLLERQGDLDGALAAYGRADDRGDAVGAFNLGLLLAARGDLADARAAYERAAERGDPEVEDQARAAIDATLKVVAAVPAPEAEALTSEGADADEPSDAPETDPEPKTGSVVRIWIGQRTRTEWVIALCVVGLIGVCALLMRRRTP